MLLSFIMLSESTYNMQQITSSIICLAIVIIAGVWIYRKYKNTPDGDAKLQELFESMKGIIIENIIEALENIDFSNNNIPISEIEAKFLESIYDDIWNLFDTEIEKLANTDNLLYRTLRKAITKEKVEEYVAALFSSEDIQNKIIEIYNIAIEKKNKEIIEEDKKLFDEMEAYEKDEIETDTVDDLNPMVDINVPIENQQIIPPSEEESDIVSADDESIEIIEDNNKEPEETIADTESFDEE